MAYAATLPRLERIDAWLEAAAQVEGLPEMGADGSVRAATRLLPELETRAGKQRQELGLAPLSRAHLGKDVAQGQQASLASLWAQMDPGSPGEGRSGPQDGMGGESDAV